MSEVQDRQWLSGAFSRVTIVSLLSLLSVWVFWHYRIEAPIRVHRLTPQNFDTYAYYYPTFHYAFGQLRQGEIPFWNPYQHSGTPFFANGQHLLLYPLNFPYLFLPTAEAMKISAWLHLCLAVLFSYALARVIGLSVLAAVTAGVTFAFGPGLLVLVYLPHHLYGAVWLPLQLCLVHLVVQRERKLGWGFLLGASIAAQYLGAYPMFTLFSLYAVSAYALWLLVVSWRRGTPVRELGKTSLILIGAGILALALSAPQLLPAIELSRLSPRPLGGLTIEDADPNYRRSDALRILLDALLPTRNGHFFRPIAQVGVIALVLASFSLLHRRHRDIVVFFAVFTLAAGALALGRHTPLYRLYFELPTGDLFRRPDRFFTICSFGLAMLTGFGVDWLWRSKGTQRVGWGVFMLSSGLALLLAFTIWINESFWQEVGPSSWRSGPFEPLRQRVVLLACYLVVVAGWLLLFLGSANRLRKVLVALIPLGIYASLMLTFENVSALPELEPNLHVLPAPVVSFLKARQGFTRTYIPPPGILGNTEGAPPSKAGVLHKIYCAMDRENVYPTRLSHFMLQLENPIGTMRRQMFRGPNRRWIPQGEFRVDPDSPNLRLLDLLGTEFLIEGASAPYLRSTDRFEAIYEAEGVRVYRNANAFPRAYVVHRSETIVEPERVLERLIDPSFDPKESVILEQPSPQQLSSSPGLVGDAARILRYEPHEVEIEAHAAEPGFLVFTDQYYNGWEAEVDGIRTPIFRANYLFRAVPLDAGAHRVVFRYVPRTFYYGLALAFSALVFCAAGLIVAWRKPVIGAEREA